MTLKLLNWTISYHLVKPYILILNTKITTQLIEVKSSLIKSLASLNAFKDKYGKVVGEKIIIKNKPLNYGDNTTYLPIYLTFNL